MAFKRAGATGVLTYHALDAARLIADDRRASRRDRAAARSRCAAGARRETAREPRASRRSITRSLIGTRSRTAPSNRPWSEVFSQRLDPEFAEEGRDPAPVLDYVGACIDRPGLRDHSARGSWPTSPAAAFPIRRSATCSPRRRTNIRASLRPVPGAVRIENACAAWLASVIGYPADAAGTLTSGGSIANLTAVVAAREARDPEGGGAVYVTRFAHYCVDKALHIAGRGRSPKRIIATDESYRMSVEALEQALEEDRAQRHPPVAGRRVGAAPSTPARSIRCRRSPSYAAATAPGSMSTAPMAGLFALCDEGRALLRGIEQADSVALDPHKTLFLPYGTGAALVRDGKLLQDAFSAMRRIHSAARRVRSRAVARRPFARAHSPLPRAPSVAAAADGRHRGIPRRTVGEACARPLFPCAPVRDRRLRPRPRAAALGCRLPLPAEDAATSTNSTSG